MANYLSRPIETAPVVSNYNFDLINKVLATKQGRYEQNRAMIEQGIAQIENLKVARPQDQEYLDARLSQMYNTLNMGEKDLSSGIVADTYYSAIKSVAQDPNIVNAVGSTRVYDNFNANLQKMQSDPKTTGLVNNKNIAYSLEKGGWNDYMAGKTDSVKSLSYVQYTDVRGKVNERIERLMKLSPKETIEVDGRIITRENLSASEIRRIAESSFDDNDMMQLEVEAWYNSNGFTDTSFLDRASKALSSTTAQLSFDRAEVERNIKKGGTDKQMAEWNSKLNNIVSQENAVKNYTTDVRSAATFLERENVIGGVVGTYSPLYSESNTINWQEKNYNLQVEKFKYQMDKDARTEAKEQVLLNQGTQTITDPTITEMSREGIISEFDKGTTEIKQTVDNYTTQYKSRLTQLASTNKDAAEIVAEYNNRIKNKQAGQTDLDVFRDIITERGGSLDSSLTTFKVGDESINYVDEIKSSVRKYSDRMNAYNKFKEEDDREYTATTLDSDSTLKAFNSNPNTKMLWNGVATPVHQVLKQRGIIDNQGNKVGSLLDPQNADVLQELKKSYFADYSLSNSDAGGVNPRYVAELSKMFGEDVNTVIEKYTYRAKVTDPYDVGGSGKYVDKQAMRINANTKTGQYIESARKQGIRELWRWSDQSLSSDDATIGKYINGYFNRQSSKSAEENLRKFTSYLPETQAINITSENPRYKALSQYVAGQALATGQTDFVKKDNPILLRNIDNDYIEVSVLSGTTKDPSVKPIRILKRDFIPQFPEISNRVDFETNKAENSLRVYAGRSVVSDNVKFAPESDVNRKEYLTDNVLRPYNGAYDVFADAESTKNMFKTNVNFAPMKQGINGYNNLVDRVVDSSGDYTVSLDVSNGATKVAIKLTEKSTGDVIHSLPMNVDSSFRVDSIVNLIEKAPEVLYANIISDIFAIQSGLLPQGIETPAYTRLVNSLDN